MKKAIILVTLLVSFTATAQQGINYKAVIKDDLGNVVANDLISVQFSILQGVAETNVYTENHTPTTDANGLIILNIGEGTTVSGDYSTINWASDTHALNVQINTGGGLVDMGTTMFKAVPYALVANNVKNVKEIKDLDNDTKIQVEENADDDIIRFDIAGTEFFRMDRGRLEVDNTGNSIFIGENAGINDDFSSNRNIGLGSFALWENVTGDNNIAIGLETMLESEGSSNNVAIGSYALSLTTGDYNIALGGEALFSNTSGTGNIALGQEAMYSNNGGANNIANGLQALYNNISGNSNIANGYQALFTNTTGSYNIANGFEALYSNTTGYYNIATGNNALYENRIGNNNIASGSYSLTKNTIGNSNIAIGEAAMFSNTTGSLNIAAGRTALRNNNSGTSNIAFGLEALYANTSGANNIAIGESALESNGTGNRNISIGAYSFLNGNQNYDYAIVIGDNSNAGGNNTARIGNSSTTSIGGSVNWTMVSDARFKTNVKEDVKGLEFILQLRPVTYNLNPAAIAKFYKSDNKNENKEAEAKKAAIVESGFIAQEVEAMAKSLGYDFSGVDAPQDETQHYGLRYASFVVPLVKAVQEQQAIIEAQQIIIENQSKQLEALLSRVEVLEASSSN